MFKIIELINILERKNEFIIKQNEKIIEKQMEHDRFLELVIFNSFISIKILIKSI
jgi:hypothetical protein